MTRRPTRTNTPPACRNASWRRAALAAAVSAVLFAAGAARAEPPPPPHVDILPAQPDAPAEAFADGGAEEAVPQEGESVAPAAPAEPAPADATAAVDQGEVAAPTEGAPVAAPDESPAAPAAAEPAPAEGEAVAAPTTMPTTAPSGAASTKPARSRAPRRSTGQPASMLKGLVVPVIAKGVGPDGNISLMTFKSVVVATELPYKAVSITNPEVADFNRINDNEILLTAKKPGNTQLMIWNTAGRSQVVDVNVGTDVQALRDQLARIFPKSKIEATNVNGTIVLRGRVQDLHTAEQVAAVAKPFAEHVLNMMEIAGGQQVMLQVRFAEVSRAASTELGFNTFATDGTAKFGTINGPGGNPIGGLAGAAQGANNAATAIGTGVTVFGAGQAGNVAFEYFIQALRRNNLLRILAEPNLVATSGEKASFLAGGEFPIPVPQDNGGGGTSTITVEFKQFGVRLNFLPTVMGDGRVHLDVEPEVSELDFSRSVSLNGFVIPSLTKRTLRTTIELRDGQTFAVGGLLSSRVTANKDVTPLLGDLPVLGVLFRSTRYERNETELVVLVTPRLVEAMNPGQVPPLPGEHWRHPTESELLLDRDLGGPATPADAGRTHEIGGPATRPAAAGTSGGAGDRQGAAAPARFRGRYGFTPAD